MQNLPTEHARQAFRLRDKDQTGTIPALEFVELMTQIRGFRMSEHVQENLLSVRDIELCLHVHTTFVYVFLLRLCYYLNILHNTKTEFYALGTLILISYQKLKISNYHHHYFIFIFIFIFIHRWQVVQLVGRSVILISKLLIRCWETWNCSDKLFSMYLNQLLMDK